MDTSDTKITEAQIDAAFSAGMGIADPGSRRAAIVRSLLGFTITELASYMNQQGFTADDIKHLGKAADGSSIGSAQKKVAMANKLVIRAETTRRRDERATQGKDWVPVSENIVAFLRKLTAFDSKAKVKGAYAKLIPMAVEDQYLGRTQSGKIGGLADLVAANNGARLADDPYLLADAEQITGCRITNAAALANVVAEHELPEGTTAEAVLADLDIDCFDRVLVHAVRGDESEYDGRTIRKWDLVAFKQVATDDEAVSYVRGWMREERARIQGEAELANLPELAAEEAESIGGVDDLIRAAEGTGVESTFDDGEPALTKEEWDARSAECHEDQGEIGEMVDGVWVAS